MHVNVKRNYQAPSFGQTEYTVSVHEKQPLHDVILQMKATDPDKVSITSILNVCWDVAKLFHVFNVPYIYGDIRQCRPEPRLQIVPLKVMFLSSGVLVV